MPSRSPTVAELQVNLLFRGLSEITTKRIIEAGTYESLQLRHRVYEAEEPFVDVYFPLDAVLSVVALLEDGTEIEIGTIGREGTSGFPIVAGAATASNVCYCQVRGDAVKLPASVFKELAATDASFRRRLELYLQAYITLLGQLVACNRLHTIYARCARWLLMTRDRVDVDNFPLTHEFLAMMLGTDRSGVALAAGILRNSGYIQYTHGTMTIINRTGLEEAACECYRVAREQFNAQRLRDA